MILTVMNDSAIDERPWNVLHVVANHEKRVAKHLAVREIEYYLPLYSEESQWSDRTVTVQRPLFAGYVFARFVPEARLQVVSTPSVLQLLCDSKHESVSAVEVAHIRAGLMGSCQLRPHIGVAVGSRVRVRSGIFEGSEGIVEKFSHECKVVMTLQATGQSFSLEINGSDVEVLNKQK
jgi:transcription antitermination factor NusG